MTGIPVPVINPVPARWVGRNNHTRSSVHLANDLGHGPTAPTLCGKIPSGPLSACTATVECPVCALRQEREDALMEEGGLARKSPSSYRRPEAG